MSISKVSMEEIKSQIKQWEYAFHEEYKRKPFKDDIKQAPKDIKELYRKYWKFKPMEVNMQNQKEDAIWSSQFNKANQESVDGSSSSQTMLQGYSQKLKEQADKEVFVPAKQHLKILMPLSKSSRSRDNISSSIAAETNLPNNILKKFDFIPQSTAMEDIAPKELKISNVTNFNQPVKQICILPSFTNDLHFQNNIKESWLERCVTTNSIIEDESLCESSTQNLKDSEVFSISTHNVNSHDKCNPASIIFKNPVNNPLPTIQEKHLNATDVTFLQPHNGKQSNEKIRQSFATEIGEISAGCFQEHGSIIQKSIVHKSEENEVLYQQANSSSRKRSRSSSSESLCATNINQLTKSVALSGFSEVSVHNDASVNSLVSDLHLKRTLKSENGFEKFDQSLQEQDDNINKKKVSHLTKKIASGTLNENFVRVNIKKKHFARGHRKVNVKKMKWQKWKSMKRSPGCSSSSASNTNCFKCGEIGHWAYKCPLNKIKSCSADYSSDDLDTPLPTLEEAEALCEKSSRFIFKNKFTTEEVKIYATENHSLDVKNNMPFDDVNTSDNVNFISKCSTESTDNCKSTISPLFSKESISDIPQEVYDGLKKIGYSKFREGQDKAVMRILCGLSTLVILPTGAGKSLCYQLPAYLYAQKYKCITLVISPLVSLMEDQMRGVSSCLNVVSLHGTMTPEEKKKSMSSLSNGTAQILLVSPEMAIGRKEQLPTELPPVAFACIDEVHCLSEWSHNFRPSYLQLYKVLVRKYGVGCILGLTATATKATAADLSCHLDLKDDEDSVVGNITAVPHNLHLSVSRDIDKDWALIKLLKGDRFKQCSSIIIYCIRRDETERIASLVRTCMQDEGTVAKDDHQDIRKGKTKKHGLIWSAGAYHAGLVASKRRSIQKQFMSGKLHVIVATIAFGMGLNKPDVRAVIHYNMPKSFESYVQEIGRAGRDGVDSHCHLFLHSENQDLCELKRHIHSNGIDRITVRKLLRKIFIPCKCIKSSHTNVGFNTSKEDITLETQFTEKLCPKHELAFPIDSAIEELDLKEESISTLLCYLELHQHHWIEQLPPAYATCKIHCYGGQSHLYQLAQKHPIVAMALAYGKRHGKEWDGSSAYEFQIIDLASHMNIESGKMKREFKKLEWNEEQNRKSGVLIEFSSLSFHLRAPGNLTDDQLDIVLDFLFGKVNTQERFELEKLRKLNSMFQRFSHVHYWSCCDEVDKTKSDAIKAEIGSYFDTEGLLTFTEIDKKNSDLKMFPLSLSLQENLESSLADQIKVDIRDIICTNHDQNFAARAIARIFHGIGSPCYPAEVWGRVKKFWRCHLSVDFHIILKLANEILKKNKLIM